MHGFGGVADGGAVTSSAARVNTNNSASLGWKFTFAIKPHLGVYMGVPIN